MKFKPKTRTRLLILLSIVVLAGGGAAGLYKYRKIRIDRGFAAARVEGLAAAESGDNRQAIDKLGFYLGRYPTDEQVLIAYVKCRPKVEEPQLRHVRDTITASRRLLSVNPNRVDERRGLMELYFKLDQRTEALEQALALLKQVPNDAKGMEVKTIMLIRLGKDTTEQRAAADAWVSAQPRSLEAQITLMQLRKRDGEALKAIITDLHKPGALDDARRMLLLAIAQNFYGEIKDAEDNLKAAAKQPAPDEAFSAMLISQMRAMSLNEEADEVQRTAGLQATGRELRWQYASRLWEKRDNAAVVELLKDLDPSSAGSDVNLLALRTMALKAVGRADEAGKILSAIESRDDAVAKAWVMALSQNIRGEKIEPRKFIDECKQALAKDPYNAFLLTFLGDAQNQQRDVNLAIEAYERATGANMTWTAPPQRLRELLMSQGRFEQARQAAVIAWQRSRRSVTDPKTGKKSFQYANDLTIELAEALGACEEAGLQVDADNLLSLVTEIQTKAPGEPKTIGIYVHLLAKHDKNAATKVVNAALASEKPLPAKELLRLASVSRAAGLGLEEACLAAYEKGNGLTPELAFTRALRLNADGKSTQGRDVIENGLAKAGEKEKLSWELAKARYLDLSGDEGAAAYWMALGDNHPESLDVQQAVSASARLAGKREFMERTLERLSKLATEDSVTLRLARARAEVRSIKNVDDAEKAALDLTKLVQTHREVAEFHLLLALALDAAKKSDQALDHLITAASLQTSSPVIWLEVAMRLQAQGDIPRAKQYLARAGIDSLEDPFQVLEASVLLAEQGQIDKAVALLERMRGRDSDARAQMALAGMYRAQKQFDKAEQTWRDAMAKTPSLEGVLFGVNLFTAQNRAADAEATMAMLDRLTLEPGVKELVWGDYFKQLRRIPEAGKKYREAARLNPKSGGAWRSVIAYELVYGKLDDALTALEEAHQAAPGDAGLAAIYARAGVLREVGSDVRARSIASLFVNDPIANGPAIDALAALIEARKQGDPIKYSAAVQDFAERFPRLLVAQVLLAEMHLQLGRPEQATRVAERVLNTFGSSEEALYRCTTVFEGAGAWEDLLKTATAWKTQFPASAQNADLAAARAYIETSRFAQAVDLLNPYAPPLVSQADKNQVFFRLYLTALAAAGRADLADHLAGELIKGEVGRLLVISSIAAQIPDAEARKWLDEAWELESKAKADSQLRIASVWAALAARTGKDADKARARELLTQVSKRTDVTPDVLTGAGMAMEIIKDADAAEKLYQQALASGSNNAVAQNNLAVILAAKGGRKDLDEAIRLASVAVKTLPAQPALRDTLASVLAHDKQWAQAVESMKEAVRLEPANMKWRTRLADYLADSGKLDDARKQIDVVDSLGPQASGGTPDVKSELAKVRLKLGN